MVSSPCASTWKAKTVNNGPTPKVTAENEGQAGAIVRFRHFAKTRRAFNGT